MAAEVISLFVTCKKVYEKFTAAYNVFSEVVTNFREQRCLLKEKADFLNSRMRNIEETLSKQPEETFTELRKHLTETEKVFKETTTFLEEVKETKSGTVVTFLKSLLLGYQSYKQRFKDFTEKLHDLGNKLDQLITDVIPKVFDLQKQLLKQQEDMHRDMTEIRILLEEMRDSRAKKKSAPGIANIVGWAAAFIGEAVTGGYASFHTTSKMASNEVFELEALLDQVEMEVKNEIEAELRSIR